MYEKIITGVGPRDAKSSSLDKAFIFGRLISDRNMLLRTGDAGGMDDAFLKGWSSGSKVGDCIVYGPYNSYSAKTGECWKTDTFTNYQGATDVVKSVVPHWDSAYSSIKANDPERYSKKILAFRKLHTRNYFQVAGDNFTILRPSDIVLFSARKLTGIYVGGTATTIRLGIILKCKMIDVDDLDSNICLSNLDSDSTVDDIIPF